MDKTLSELGTMDMSVELERASEAPPLRWTILYHPDPTRVGQWSELPSGVGAMLSRLSVGFGPRGDGAPLGTPCVSRAPLRLEPGPGAGLWLRLPAPGYPLHVDAVPIEGDLLIDGARLDRGCSVRLGKRVLLWLQRSPRAHRAHPGRDYGLVGQSPPMEALRAEMDRVADFDLPVLLRGETGTGKELVAAALHAHGPRRARPLVALNMAALNPSTATSELFGHTRGAFTGASRDQPGYFVQAHGGTLFLDEIGELPRPLQAMLLRTLETGEVQRVGGGPTRVDVRIVSATDADLEADCQRGHFSMPLLQRINGYTLRLPPLRRRRQDIPTLLHHFLRQILTDTGELHRLAAPTDLRQDWMSPRDLERLVHHDWPGNARELRNVARQMAVYSRLRPRLELPEPLRAALTSPATPPHGALTDAPSQVADAAPLRAEATPQRADDATQSAEFDLERVRQALRDHGWSLKDAASALGVSRSTLYRWIEASPALHTAADLDAQTIDRAIEAHGGDLHAAARALEVSHRGLLRQMTSLGIERKG